MIIADTGFWLALANRRDRFHQLAHAKLQEIAEPLVTTWPVLTETCHLLCNRLGVHAQLRLMNSYEEGAFRVHELESKNIKRISTLFIKYQDLPMDLADASLVILAESMGHGRIFSTDQRDFHAYRWKNRYPFENLLFV